MARETLPRQRPRPRAERDDPLAEDLLADDLAYEDEIPVTDRRGRVWYLRRYPRGRYDYLGFTWFWWLWFWVAVAIVVWWWGWGW
jgi:hypothetical protein